MRAANIGLSLAYACCLAIVTLIGFSAITTGAVLLIQGDNYGDAAEELNPGADFSRLPEACVIADVIHSSREEEDSHGYRCYDDYSYIFSYQGQRYKSRQDGVLRYGGVCSGSQPRAPVYIVGEEVPCWQPNTRPVAVQYNCGNQMCYKVFDPEEEVKIAKDTGDAMEAAGLSSLICGLLCCGCCSPAVWCAGKNRVGHASGPPMPGMHGGPQPAAVVVPDQHGKVPDGQVVQGRVIGQVQGA
eukprot:CAMPEP_0204277532 /NCGR_PEP_ID=MMETSP0468-20130131/29360_1 /ASSEMBLY_ACC=CAM_ASM_000383 /TAXON_ID=2969 /ORGANISM="Oxyrrhis marina" /LENGTH=242 /DNA_ID=CAMNT_0051254331 /DNA_START=29 /DNA_END=757 /DNA_ORIENTATION=+